MEMIDHSTILDLECNVTAVTNRCWLPSTGASTLKTTFPLP